MGIIESTTGGFKFPDGSQQTTAAVGATGALPSLRAYLDTSLNTLGDKWVSLPFNHVEENFGGGYDASTNIYTIPEDGWYTILLRGSGSNCSYGLVPRVIINGTIGLNGNGDAIGTGHLSVTTYLTQRSTLSFQIFHGNYSFVLNSGANNTYIQIRKLSN